MSQAPVTVKMTTGPIHSVPCPHCGHRQDLRIIRDAARESFEVGAFGSCDKCLRVWDITMIQPVVVVKLRQRAGRRGDGGAGGRHMDEAQPAQTRAPMRRR